MPNRNFPTSLLVTKHFALLLSLLLLVSNCLLTQTATAAFLPPNPVLSENGLSANGAACSRVPMPALVKHATTAYCANNGTANEMYWHVLVVDLNFDESQAQCSGALGVACASRGSALLPYRDLGTAIGEAMRTGADLLLLSDIDTSVSIPAGLALHGTGSSLVAQYYPQYYSGNTGNAITTLSGTLSVVNAGGSAVGSTPTVLCGLRLSFSITVNGHFGSGGVWFVETVLEVPIIATRATGSMVVTRSHVTGVLLFYNADASWMPSSNDSATMTVDCNYFDGFAGTLVLFNPGNRKIHVHTDVHDNYFDDSSIVFCIIANAAQAQTRFARNHVQNFLNLAHSQIDESLIAVGENLFSQATGAITDNSDTIQSSVYANLMEDSSWRTTSVGIGNGGVLSAHVDNRHVSYLGGPTPLSLSAYFAPSALLPTGTVSRSALVFERNVLAYASPADSYIAMMSRQLPGSSDQSSVHMLLSTKSNFVHSVSPAIRFAQLNLDAPTGLPANHVSAVRSQGDWLSYISGARLYRPDGPGYMLSSTYSVEVNSVQAYRIGNIADMYVSPAFTSYGCTFSFQVEENTAEQVGGFPTGITVFALPHTMMGGQTDVRIAHNHFSTVSSKKRGEEDRQNQFAHTNAAVALRAFFSYYTEAPPSAAYGPYFGGGGVKRRSISVPYTVPYIGGLSFYEGAHHSFSFVDNQVTTENTYTAAMFNMNDFYFGALLPGAVTVETHVDRNHFYTLGSSSTVVYISQTDLYFIGSATALRLENTADNNVFESQAATSAQAILMYAEDPFFESGSSASVRFSASYNLVGTFRSGAPALETFGLFRLGDGVTLAADHDVYRLNYDCELRGNLFVREQGAGNLIAPFIGATMRMDNSASSAFVRPVHVRQSTVIDDNHFNEHCVTSADAFIANPNFIRVDSDQEARSSVAQTVRMRGNYVAQGALGDQFIYSQTQLYTGYVRTSQFDAELSNNKAPSMSSFGVQLQNQHFSTVLPALDSKVVVESNELGVCGTTTIEVINSGSAVYYRGSARVSDNRMFASGATSANHAVLINGFSDVSFSDNQLMTIDNSVTTFSDNLVVVTTDAQQRDTSVRIADNRLHDVDLGAYAFQVYTNTVATDNAFSFVNNRFERVSGAYALYTGTSGPNEVCGYFSGNSFSGSSSATLPQVQSSGPFYYEQVAPDGMDLSGLSAALRE
eukprot:CAMPEP_0177664608 /NCGR_PEP_ID=MMETSP0447-20121125/20590_1 /TAXON_ID=0 /ORGANISM="Stygamoeba regulata, Strain BSH-02190019" /LENGTH=1193 /DNA_ID=CAMNT_0019170603 /DNA_START=122 /DNA_END=3701 /DNA_ORIENTATION=+